MNRSFHFEGSGLGFHMMYQSAWGGGCSQEGVVWNFPGISNYAVQLAAGKSLKQGRVQL